MVTAAKHPTAPSRLRDGANKEVLAMEGGLAPLCAEPPSSLGLDEADVWNREIVPLIERGILKESDYTSCVHYCQLAVIPVLDLPGPKLTYLNKLKSELGLTPKARLNLASGTTPQTSTRLSDIMSLGEK